MTIFQKMIEYLAQLETTLTYVCPEDQQPFCMIALERVYTMDLFILLHDSWENETSPSKYAILLTNEQPSMGCGGRPRT